MSIPVNLYVEVKHYPYRTAHMNNIAIGLPRDANKDLEEELAERAGVAKDNHVLYTLTRGEDVICVQITDDQIYIGTGLIEESW